MRVNKNKDHIKISSTGIVRGGNFIPKGSVYVECGASGEWVREREADRQINGQRNNCNGKDSKSG